MSSPSGPRTKTTFSLIVRNVFVGIVFGLTFISQIVSLQIFQVPLAHAADDTFGANPFSGFFDNCADDNNPQETQWENIKTCLNAEHDIVTSLRDRWLIVKPKMFAIFDALHAGTPETGLPAEFVNKSYFVTTPAGRGELSGALNAFVREENDGLAGLNNMGLMLDALKMVEIMGAGGAGGVPVDDPKTFLCNLLDTLKGGSSVNTGFGLGGAAGLGAYRDAILYGPDERGDGPTCDTDVLATDERPYLVRGVPLAITFFLADLLGDPAVNVNIFMGEPSHATAIRNIASALRAFILNPPSGTRGAIVTKHGRDYLDLGMFMEQNNSVFGTPLGDGPIEALFKYCQSLKSGEAANVYVQKIFECYQSNVERGNPSTPMTAQPREFVNDIIIPATQSYASFAASAPADQQARIKNFMKSGDYADLAEGYDSLSTERQNYLMKDYLSQTITDGYSDGLCILPYSGCTWVYDTTDLVQGPGANIDNAVTKDVLRHLVEVNNRLTAPNMFTKYLDPPLPAGSSSTAAPAATPTSTTAAGTGTRQDSMRTAIHSYESRVGQVQVESKRNVLLQLNDYINRTASKDTFLRFWYLLAAADHDPNYRDAITHVTGDLSLMAEGDPGRGLWDTVLSDPYLARITNGCSPSTFTDDIDRDHLLPFKTCLEYEKEYVDHSDTNKSHHLHAFASLASSSATLAASAEPMKMKRSQSMIEGIQAIIQIVDTCIATPTCQHLDDEELGDIGSRVGGANPERTTATNVASALLNAVLSLLNVLLSLIVKFLLWLTALVMDMFNAVLNYTGFTTEGFVVAMWRAIRDFVNLFFILALLVIAIANIVQYQINTYAIKTILPKFILIVLAVNFSRLFTGLVIDAGNVMEAGVYQIGGMGPHGAGGTAACSNQSATSGTFTFAIPDRIKEGSVLCRLAKGLKFEELQAYATREEGTVNQVDLFWVNLVLLIMLIMMMFGFLALAVTFTIRIIILWGLVIMSPLYVISKLFPFTSSIGSQWEGKFFKYATMQVGVAFFLTMAAMSASMIGTRIFGGVSQVSTGSVGNLHPGGFTTWADYLQLGFLMAMIYAGVFTAAKSDYGTGLIDKIASYGRSPLAGAKLFGRGAGMAVGLTGTVGRRLQAVERKGALGKLARFTGGIIAAPSNVIQGGKAVVGELKRGAEERKAKFGLETAKKLSYGVPFGGVMRERFKAQLLANENKIVQERKEDLKLRLSIDQIRDRGRKALAQRNALDYKAAMLALAERGALKLGEVVDPKTGETIKDRLRADEQRRTGSTEQADNFIENLESTNIRARDQKQQEMAGFVGRTGDKRDIDRRLQKAMKDNDDAAIVGLLTEINKGGRIKNEAGTLDGAALGLARLLQATRQEGVQINDDDRRKITTAAKEAISSYAAQFRDTGTQANFEKDLFEVLKNYKPAEYGGYTDYTDFLAKIRTLSPEDRQKEMQAATELMGQLGTGGIKGGPRLVDIVGGAALAEKVAALRKEMFVGLNMNGDDGTAPSMVSLLDAESLAEAHRMTESGKFNNGDPAQRKMIQELVRGLVENADKGDAHSTQMLDDYIDNMKVIATNAAQKNTLKLLLKEVEENVNRERAKSGIPPTTTAPSTSLNKLRTDLT